MTPAPKIKRIKNPKLCAEVAKLPCVIGDGCRGRVVAHHVTAVGAGGDDVQDNLCPLCWKHHVPEVHKHGDRWMCETYPQYRQWLVDHDRTRILGKVDRFAREQVEKIQIR